ncbi:MAG: primosomal protein N' (replication factor Y) - superfamily II helicase, partial [Pseudomonadota bacterium]
ALQAWLGSLWFAPNGVADYARKGRRMNGIYVPYWTFDADTKSSYSGQRGTHYYETQTVMRDGKSETRRVRKTRWRSVSGRVARFFDDVLVLASTSLPKKYTDRLSPWDLSDLRPYQPEYLAGFRAEAYTVELDAGFEEAKVIMNRQIERDVRFDIGGDAQRISTLNTQVRDVTFKHLLLPVWMAAYKYRGKSYRFVVNGRTGLVQGERPFSAWKIALAVIVLALVAGVAGYFYAMNA